MINSVDPDQAPRLRRLIWFYTVLPGLSVRLHIVNTVVTQVVIILIGSKSAIVFIHSHTV